MKIFPELTINLINTSSGSREYIPEVGMYYKYSV